MSQPSILVHPTFLTNLSTSKNSSCPKCHNVSTGKRIFTAQRQSSSNIANVTMSQATRHLFTKQASTKSYNLECHKSQCPNPPSPAPLYTLPEGIQTTITTNVPAVPIRHPAIPSLPVATQRSYQNHHKCPGRPNIIHPPIPLNGKAFQQFPTRGILNNNVIIAILKSHVPSQIGHIEPGELNRGGGGLDSSATF